MAKAGIEERLAQIGGSCIVAPPGEIAAACTPKGDEIAVVCRDLDLRNSYKHTTFNFELHRWPSDYGLIVERKGVRLKADCTPIAEELTKFMRKGA